MKRILLLFLMSLPLVVMGQEIRTEVDEFTGDKIISSTWERIYKGGRKAQNQTKMRLRNINGITIVDFNMFSLDVFSCDKGNFVMFKTDKGIVKLHNIEFAITKPETYRFNSLSNAPGIVLNCGGDISRLSQERIIKARFYFNDGYRELDFKDEESEYLMDFFKMFNKAVIKEKYSN